MRLLLTSAGVNNPSIHDALAGMLGKPIDECNALCIPTAQYGHPHVGPGVKPWAFVSGREDSQMTQLGWKSVGLLELTALPSIDEERWVPLVRETDVLLAAGGDSLYLCHWMRECGLAAMLPTLSDTVWVGLSGGSMVMTPRIGQPFMGGSRPAATTTRSDSSTLPSTPTSTIRCSRATPWPTPRNGRPCSTARIRDRRRHSHPRGRRRHRRRVGREVAGFDP